MHLPDLDGDPHASLTTKEGWRRFVDDLPEPPRLLAATERQQLTLVDRGRYDEARLGYHARLITVATPTIRQVTATGRRLVLLNRHQVSARRGLVVTGQAATGKTTAITQLGRSHELLVRRRDPAAHTRLPVAYVTVPPAATPRMLAAEFARFLGLPVTPRLNQADITNRVCDVGTRQQRQQWRALIATLEQALRLRDHTPGSLLKLDTYLHQRTSGMIGSLSHLLRGAAIEAIQSGAEKITKAILETIKLDHAAQTAQPRPPRARRRQGPTATAGA